MSFRLHMLGHRSNCVSSLHHRNDLTCRGDRRHRKIMVSTPSASTVHKTTHNRSRLRAACVAKAAECNGSIPWIRRSRQFYPVITTQDLSFAEHSSGTQDRFEHSDLQSQSEIETDRILRSLRCFNSRVEMTGTNQSWWTSITVAWS